MQVTWGTLIDLRLLYEQGRLSDREIIEFYKLLIVAGWLNKMPDIWKVQARILKREGLI